MVAQSFGWSVGQLVRWSVGRQAGRQAGRHLGNSSYTCFRADIKAYCLDCSVFSFSGILRLYDCLTYLVVFVGKVLQDHFI